MEMGDNRIDKSHVIAAVKDTDGVRMPSLLNISGWRLSFLIAVGVSTSVVQQFETIL